MQSGIEVHVTEKVYIVFAFHKILPYIDFWNYQFSTMHDNAHSV